MCGKIPRLLRSQLFLTQVRLEDLHSRLRLSCIMADKMSSTHKVPAFLLQTPCYLDPHHRVAGPGQLELPRGREAGGIPTRESRPGGDSHSTCHFLDAIATYSHSMSLPLDATATYPFALPFCLVLYTCNLLCILVSGSTSD